MFLWEGEVDFFYKLKLLQIDFRGVVVYFMKGKRGNHSFMECE